MTKLIISTQDDNGLVKYGLLYDDSGDPYKEEWKPVLFETQEEAEKKLAVLESERAREDDATPFSMKEAQKYAESHYWKFASTYAKSAPHEYCMKKWLVEED